MAALSWRCVLWTRQMLTWDSCKGPRLMEGFMRESLRAFASFCQTFQAATTGHGTLLQTVAALRGVGPPTAWYKHHQLPACAGQATLACGGLLPLSAQRLHPGYCRRGDWPQVQRCGYPSCQKFQYRPGIYVWKQTQQGNYSISGNGGTRVYGA